MKLYWMVLGSSAISSEGNGSEKQKVSRSGPAESNEMPPVRSITEIALLSFFD